MDGVTDEDIATEIATHDEYNRKFLRARLAARNAMGISTINVSTTNISNIGRVDALIPTLGSASTNPIKLLKIELKKYDGDVESGYASSLNLRKSTKIPRLIKRQNFNILYRQWYPVRARRN